MAKKDSGEGARRPDRPIHHGFGWFGEGIGPDCFVPLGGLDWSQLGGLDWSFGRPDDYTSRFRHSSKSASVRRTVKDIRVDALRRTFSDPENQGHDYMKKAVDEYRQEVIDLSNSDLLSEYAAAALFVGDNRSAMVCYNMFERLSDGEKLVLGLLNLKSGDHKAARSFLRLVGDDPVAKIALSEIDIRDGHTHPAVHERLESITSSSYAANVVLGVAYYNVEEYVPSERHFKRALDMSHGSLASDRLNLMRAIVAQGRYEEVSKTMGAFYHDTHCALSPVEMEQELRRRPLEFPRLDLSPRFLYKIVKQCK